MPDLVWRISGVGLGLGAGLVCGWASGRMFSRPIVQDAAAVLIATLLGGVAVVGLQIARLMISPNGGLGAVSAGVSEFALVGLPATVLLAIAAQAVRPRLGNAAAVPIVLGGLGALIGAMWVASTVSSSFN